MTMTYVVNERVLTDDELTVAEPGHVLTGGYAAILTYHTFSSPWSDDAHVRRFRTLDAARDFLVARYGEDVDLPF